MAGKDEFTAVIEAAVTIDVMHEHAIVGRNPGAQVELTISIDVEEDAAVAELAIAVEVKHHRRRCGHDFPHNDVGRIARVVVEVAAGILEDAVRDVDRGTGHAGIGRESSGVDQRIGGTLRQIGQHTAERAD